MRGGGGLLPVAVVNCVGLGRVIDYEAPVVFDPLLRGHVIPAREELSEPLCVSVRVCV